MGPGGGDGTAKLAAGGEPLALAWRRNAPDLLRFLRRVLGNGATAEDVLQDVYVRLAPQWSATRKPRALLFKTALNLARDHIRRTRRRASILAEASDILWQEADTLTPERCVLAREEAAAIDAAIAALPALSRRIFLAVHAEGLTQTEAASRLGVSRVTVNLHMRRVLNHLAQVRAALEGDAEGTGAS